MGAEGDAEARSGTTGVGRDVEARDQPLQSRTFARCGAGAAKQTQAWYDG